MTELIGKLGRNDLRLIRRDNFLIFMFFFVLAIGVLLRFGLPWLNTYLAENQVLPNETVRSSLADFYPLLVAFMALFQGSLITGTIFGFMLLDEKDDNTIKALLVTPIPMNQYLFYRVGLPTVLAFAFILILIFFINQALIPFWQLIPIAIGAALTSPIASLFYAIFAENKVQGFAYGKFVSIAGWIILLGWFVSEPWQWLFGLFPPFLISKAYWMALEGNPWWGLALLAGVIFQIGVLLIMARWFHKVAHQ
ncbi:MAG: hypothetical protein AAF629_24970 [Chloroflexota bacterium]